MGPQIKTRIIHHKVDSMMGKGRVATLLLLVLSNFACSSIQKEHGRSTRSTVKKNLKRQLSTDLHEGGKQKRGRVIRSSTKSKDVVEAAPSTSLFVNAPPIGPMETLSIDLKGNTQTYKNFSKTGKSTDNTEFRPSSKVLNFQPMASSNEHPFLRNAITDEQAANDTLVSSDKSATKSYDDDDSGSADDTVADDDDTDDAEKQEVSEEKKKRKRKSKRRKRKQRKNKKRKNFLTADTAPTADNSSPSSTSTTVYSSPTTNTSSNSSSAPTVSTVSAPVVSAVSAPVVSSVSISSSPLMSAAASAAGSNGTSAESPKKAKKTKHSRNKYKVFSGSNSTLDSAPSSVGSNNSTNNN